MELSPLQRITVFAAAVLVLAGLGVYMFLPRSSAAERPPGRSPSPRSRSLPPQPSPGTAAANIYSWLPFSQAGLGSAASLTIRFANDYGTFSYTESDAAYLAPMRPLASSDLVQVIGRAFAAPGLASARTRSKQVATASAAIVS